MQRSALPTMLRSDQQMAVETDTLPVLQAGGFSATVDAFAWEPDPDPGARQMRLWFLSLLGPQESVKALWARLVKSEVVTLSFEGLGNAHFCALAPEGPRAWRFYTANLRAAAAYHAVLVPELALYASDRRDFLLLVRQPEEAPMLHYRFLNRRLDLPLHPTWTTWLWERALRASEVVPLESRGLCAYRCIPNPQGLAEDITTAVGRGALRVGDEVSR